MKGWIKDYRQEMEGDIWSMPPLYHRIWQYLKYMANHEENIIPMRDGSKLKLSPGQHLTSLRNIAQGVSWYERGVLREPNVKTVSAVIDWLEKEGMITVDTGNRKYTAISLVKWDIYQGDDDTKVTVDGLESKQPLDTNKNDKNVKNDKKIKKTKEEKKAYATSVFLTTKQYDELIKKHGEEKTSRIIKRLNDYKISEGKDYTSDYLAITRWVVEAVEGDEKRGRSKGDTWGASPEDRSSESEFAHLGKAGRS